MTRAFRPDSAWEAFVEREPYFAILNADKFRLARLSPEALGEFFESGERLAAWMLRTIEMRLVPRFSPVTILEYGCGVGRLAIPLARRGGRVTAVDRSPAMLAAARREAGRHGVPHLELQTPAELERSDRMFDLITSYLVFQRMRQEEGLEVLRSLLSRLGPGGVGVFQFAMPAPKSWLVSASRSLRRRLPGANAIANLARGKDASEPFFPHHTYSLDAVLHVLDEHQMDPTYLASGRDEQAVIFAQAPVAAGLDSSGRRSTVSVSSEEHGGPISPEQIVASTSIDALNQRAEEYFSTLKGWDHHMAKPFADIEEAPDLLTDVAILLRGLRLRAGARVVDFGSGPGWLARFLTQLGCDTVLLDVSPTALAISKHLYERQPVFGERPAPMFLVFDGRRIDLPDASVDRIVSFHAFHHVPNPDRVIAEFGRILKPGGTAGFVEPGPRHSETPVSQFEMRTYGVIERDIDVHAIWRTAQGAGFATLELAVWHPPLFHLSLERYEDFLAGGSTVGQWAGATRDFARHVRTFFLTKSGDEALDSRHASALACSVKTAAPSLHSAERSPTTIEATVTNSGTAPWLPAASGYGGVWLGAHLHSAEGGLIAFDLGRAAVADREIAPRESVEVTLVIPPQRAGRYRLEVDCVAEGVTWFAQVGSDPARIALTIA